MPAADVFTAYADWLTGTAAGETKHHEQVRDNGRVRELVTVGDLSSQQVHRHKEGTLAARPAAGNAGRLYRATDINTVYWDDGTDWRLLSGGGFYDSFDRADSTTLGNADSGHPWTEESGNMEISSGSLRVVAAAGPSLIAADLGAPLDDVAMDVYMSWRSGGVKAEIKTSFVIRYLDASNYYHVRCNGATDDVEIIKIVAGVPTTVATLAFAFGINTNYLLQLHIAGPILSVLITRQEPAAATAHVYSTNWQDISDSVTPFAGATKVGIRIDNDLADSISGIQVRVSG